MGKKKRRNRKSKTTIEHQFQSDLCSFEIFENEWMALEDKQQSNIDKVIAYELEKYTTSCGMQDHETYNIPSEGATSEEDTTDYDSPILKEGSPEIGVLMEPLDLINHPKRKFLFRYLSSELRSQIQLDPVALYSITDMKSADGISHMILGILNKDIYLTQGLSQSFSSFSKPLKKYKKKFVITDGTACVGGNVFSFAKYFGHVNAIEFNQDRYEMLCTNVTLLNYPNVSCFQGDYCDYLTNFKQDVVFLDPPWGGPNYYLQENLELYLSECPLSSICEALKDSTSYIVLKLPRNFGVDKFKKHITARNVYQTIAFRKMLVMILDYTKP